LKDAPRPVGFAVRYVSGLDQATGVSPGFWLSQYSLDNGFLNFNFDAALVLTFDTEDKANSARENLRTVEVETNVVKVG